jgi:hypothetical protein
LVGIFYGHLVYFTAIAFILQSFGIVFLFLVYCTKKNQATLIPHKYFGQFPRTNHLRESINLSILINISF